MYVYLYNRAFLVLSSKESARSAGDLGSIWIGNTTWRRAWQPTAVFLPGKSCGKRSLAGYSPWGHKESDTTEATFAHAHLHNKCILE